MADLNAIKAVAMDVDGVLTDGGFWFGTSGEEMKRFCYADVTGIGMARNAGIKLAIISGESSPDGMMLAQRIADKLKITHVYKACHDKAGAVRDFAEKVGVEVSEVCFIGDDVIDVSAMKIVGLAASPADAQLVARSLAHMVTERNGGQGAVREVMDAILKDRTQVG